MRIFPSIYTILVMPSTTYTCYKPSPGGDHVTLYNIRTLSAVISDCVVKTSILQEKIHQNNSADELRCFVEYTGTLLRKLTELVEYYKTTKLFSHVDSIIDAFLTSHRCIYELLFVIVDNTEANLSINMKEKIENINNMNFIISQMVHRSRNEYSSSSIEKISTSATVLFLIEGDLKVLAQAISKLIFSNENININEVVKNQIVHYEECVIGLILVIHGAEMYNLQNGTCFICECANDEEFLYLSDNNNWIMCHFCFLRAKYMSEDIER
ncbi:hypothetical protein THOM_1607 [Trachipleistophora hominis]|uniref:Uncharacterized protein n=1 Tax=Trachipleistophora hominis TaxID=72359 RepID=L7JVG0_TRAHO|nr:hypothetical protein THOM_1607 [Trachipleistophora hominis]